MGHHLACQPAPPLPRHTFGSAEPPPGSEASVGREEGHPPRKGSAAGQEAPPCCSLRHRQLSSTQLLTLKTAHALGPPLSSPRMSQIWLSCFMSKARS